MQTLHTMMLHTMMLHMIMLHTMIHRSNDRMIITKNTKSTRAARCRYYDSEAPEAHSTRGVNYNLHRRNAHCPGKNPPQEIPSGGRRTFLDKTYARRPPGGRQRDPRQGERASSVLDGSLSPCSQLRSRWDKCYRQPHKPARPGCYIPNTLLPVQGRTTLHAGARRETHDFKERSI